MAQTCTNCGHPALETDTVCWHCGWQLSPPRVIKANARQSEAVAEEPYPLTAVVFQGVMTVAVIIAVLLVMRSLGQKPLIIIHPETRLSADWLPVTDPAQRFTLDLPVDWTWLDESDQPRFADLLQADDQFQAALAPLSNFVEDTELLLVARGSRGSTGELTGFVVVAHSESLDALTPQQAIELVSQQAAELTIRETSLVESLTGQTQATILVDGVGDQLRCRQQLTPGQPDSFLLTACSPTAQFPRYANDLQNILNSFQILMP